MKLSKNKEKAEAQTPQKETVQSDDALFENLAQAKKKKKRKKLWTILIIIAVLLIALVIAVISLQRKVKTSFASSDEEVLSYTAAVGSISTTVSGSGNLASVDEETITVPAGVEIDKVQVEANDVVSKGDVLATVNMPSVMSAMADAQEALDDLDDEIADAASDTVSSTISSGVAGRVKILYAAAGDDVSSCMYNNGALAVLSLDGYMAFDVETTSLTAGDTVTVQREDGTTTVSGLVESVTDGTATILVKDNGPKNGEKVALLKDDGTSAGEGELYIHSALKITGYAGTIASVYVSENSYVYSGSTLFTLTDTSYSANYRTLLKQREDLEDTLMQLVTIYQDGALKAAYDGTIDSVIYDDSDSSSASTSDSDSETEVLSMYPNVSMSVTISVDETDILSLEVGQTAQVTISSISDDMSFNGTVTEISRTATSSSGVTKYSATVTLDKTEEMLAGMTASVVIRIQGVDDAVYIPVDALHQTSSESYVYTEYNEKTQEYGGKVTVTTGISNSKYVQITSGLNEGDTVYYTESDDSMGMFSFGGGDFSGEMPSGDFSGGDMPSGGSMPSGGGDFGGGSMPSGGGNGGGHGGGMPGGQN